MIRARIAQLTVEEVANTLTHGFGLALSIAGFFVLVILSSRRGDFWYILSSVVYGLSLITLYAASTCYHAALSPKFKQRLQIADHCCIYLLIAGTYTPFTLVVLRDSIGASLFILIWSCAFAGILLKLIFGKRFPVASVLSYLLMGWIGAFAVQPLAEDLGFLPIVLLMAGGGAYSIGVIFFAWKSLRHHHAVWHLFVLAGSVLHFLAIAIYVTPQVSGI